VLCCVVEQELYELLEAVNRAGSLKAVYESAMDFIRSALKCDKVAILLFDEAGVMRFVASRELSEKYRSGVEGHSPWRVGAEHAEPIWIPDTELEGLEAHIAESVKAERIRALGFIPLQVGGFVIGKFMVYFGAPHEFTARERRLTEGIAIQLALAIQRWQMAEELRRGKEQYRIMIEPAGQLSGMKACNGSSVFLRLNSSVVKSPRSFSLRRILPPESRKRNSTTPRALAAQVTIAGCAAKTELVFGPKESRRHSGTKAPD